MPGRYARWYDCRMKMQCTYSLPVEIVDQVRHLVEEQRIAPSQDALVERALVDFLMAQRHKIEARIFAEAAADPEVQAELACLERECSPLDRETWPE